ncbi:MAG TPA: pitrilysin family protein [Acidobacteriota bacterium]|nr:pitrilysin family protein [Acidobacteriota bacterium]
MQSDVSSFRSALRAGWRSLALAAVLTAAIIPAATAAAATNAATAAPRTGLEDLEKQVREFTLPNGVTFVLVERRDAPVFSFMTSVNAGSVDNPFGSTGLAHMMEHMAFKGTALVGAKDHGAEKPLLDAEEKAWQAVFAERQKGARADSAALSALEKRFAEARDAARGQVASNEFSSLLERNGVQGLNAFTAMDLTAYLYSLPSNRLELWALLEGSRMAHPVFREFYTERDVVFEERRMRYESSPFGRLLWEFWTNSFYAHPYGWTGIGYPSDLKNLSRADGEEFYRRYYVGKNITVGVVGDVALADLKNYAGRYFSDISGAAPPPPIVTVEPEQRAERRVILEDKAQPQIMIGWHIPAASDPSYRAFAAAADLLGGGEHSRLHKALVKEKKIAVRVSAETGFPGEKYPNMLFAIVTPATGQDPRVVEQEVYRVIGEAMGAKPFTQTELDGHKVRTRAQTVRAAQANGELAANLAQHQTLYGDWREFFRAAQRVQALTLADLDAAMKRSMRAANRTVAMLVPPGSGGAGGGN